MQNEIVYELFFYFFFIRPVRKQDACEYANKGRMALRAFSHDSIFKVLWGIAIPIFEALSIHMREKTLPSLQFSIPERKKRRGSFLGFDMLIP